MGHRFLYARDRASPGPNLPPPRVLGVDDWAFRKGHRYGTILYDLETHQPVDMLADRTAESLTLWLKAHPGVEIISRDRASAYSEGAREGAPDAIQVADRFHLLKNLGDALERLLNRKRSILKAVGIKKDQAAVEAGLSLPWNNGAVEGSVNRLKMIKRQMYGRAGFALLRRRVLEPT